VTPTCMHIKFLVRIFGLADEFGTGQYNVSIDKKTEEPERLVRQPRDNFVSLDYIV